MPQDESREFQYFKAGFLAAFGPNQSPAAQLIKDAWEKIKLFRWSVTHWSADKLKEDLQTWGASENPQASNVDIIKNELKAREITGTPKVDDANNSLNEETGPGDEAAKEALRRMLRQASRTQLANVKECLAHLPTEFQTANIPAFAKKLLSSEVKARDSRAQLPNQPIHVANTRAPMKTTLERFIYDGFHQGFFPRWILRCLHDGIPDDIPAPDIATLEGPDTIKLIWAEMPTHYFTFHNEDPENRPPHVIVWGGEDPMMTTHSELLSATWKSRNKQQAPHDHPSIRSRIHPGEEAPIGHQ